MKRKSSGKLVMFGTICAATCLVSLQLRAQTGVDMGCSPTVNNPCGGGGGGSTGGSGGNNRGAERAAREERERAARNAVYSAKVQEVDASWRAAHTVADWTEVLRLAYEQQKLRDGPVVQATITAALDNLRHVQAEFAWNEAKTAADRRRAIAIRPQTFSEGNIRYVEQLEAAEREERERPKREAAERRVRAEREAADMKVAAKMRAKMDEFTSTLAPAASKAPLGLSAGDVVPDGLDGHRVQANVLQFGDPDALESLSAQARSGFDTPGRPMGSDIGPMAAAAAKREIVIAEKDLTRLTGEREALASEIRTLSQERDTEKDPGKVMELTKALDQKIVVNEKKLAEITQTTKKIEKLHRTIESKVEGTGAETPKKEDK